MRGTPFNALYQLRHLHSPRRAFLRGLRRGVVRVTIVLRTTSGRRLVRTRRYRTCVPRRAVPGLR